MFTLPDRWPAGIQSDFRMPAGVHGWPPCLPDLTPRDSRNGRASVERMSKIVSDFPAKQKHATRPTCRSWPAASISATGARPKCAAQPANQAVPGRPTGGFRPGPAGAIPLTGRAAARPTAGIHASHAHRTRVARRRQADEFRSGGGAPAALEDAASRNGTEAHSSPVTTGRTGSLIHSLHEPT